MVGDTTVDAELLQCKEFRDTRVACTFCFSLFFILRRMHYRIYMLRAHTMVRPHRSFVLLWWSRISAVVAFLCGAPVQCGENLSSRPRARKNSSSIPSQCGYCHLARHRTHEGPRLCIVVYGPQKGSCGIKGVARRAQKFLT